jgi:prepilin-type N-terminal cleavage/methylation domain-containing protein
MNERRQQVAFPAFGPARNGERGLTLIEILVALGILAAVAVIFLVGMETSSKAVMVSQERVTADSLAKSQMEYVKSQLYDADYPPVYGLDPDISIPQGYGIAVTAERWDPVNDVLSTDDTGLQKITVTITRDGEPEPVLTVVGYKVNR